MNKKSILILTGTLALAGLGFYFYKKRQSRLAYEKSVENITEEYQVFN
jgi:LPXTG-motif cell wall-anchored protein